MPDTKKTCGRCAAAQLLLACVSCQTLFEGMYCGHERDYCPGCGGEGHPYVVPNSAPKASAVALVGTEAMGAPKAARVFRCNDQGEYCFLDRVENFNAHDALGELAARYGAGAFLVQFLEGDEITSRAKIDVPVPEAVTEELNAPPPPFPAPRPIEGVVLRPRTLEEASELVRLLQSIDGNLGEIRQWMAQAREEDAARREAEKATTHTAAEIAFTHAAHAAADKVIAHAAAPTPAIPTTTTAPETNGT